MEHNSNLLQAGAIFQLPEYKKFQDGTQIVREYFELFPFRYFTWLFYSKKVYRCFLSYIRLYLPTPETCLEDTAVAKKMVTTAKRQTFLTNIVLRLNVIFTTLRIQK